MALFHYVRVAAVCLCAWPIAALAADQDRVDALEHQLREARRQLGEIKAARHEGDDQALKQLQRSSDAQYARVKQGLDARPRTDLENGRLNVSSADGAFSVALRGTVQFDTAYFAQGRNPPSVDLNSGTNFRRAQFGLLGTLWHDWAYNFTYDFGGSGVEQRGYLYRAYIEYDGFEPVGIRAGAFSAYDSMEDATGGANLALLERPAAVTIARSIAAGSGRSGVEIFAQGERYLVSLALTGGRTTDAATFDEQQGIVGRAAWLAVDREDVKWLVNVDATHVFRLGDAAPGVANMVQLSAGPEISVDASRTVDTGLLDARHVTEYGLESALRLGRLFGQAGWFHYNITRRFAAPDPDFGGWYAMATWSLSGESRPYDPVSASFHGLLPDRPLGKAGFGAWEVAARYSIVDLDFMPGHAGGVTGGRQAVWSAGLNWYPNQTIRFLLDYDNIRVTHGNSRALDISADAIALRSQIAF